MCIRINMKMSVQFYPGYIPDTSSAEDKCPICIEALENKTGTGVDTETNTKILGCNHVFHEECVNAWLLVNDTCPICRRLVNTNNIKNKTKKIYSNRGDSRDSRDYGNVVIDIDIDSSNPRRNNNTENVFNIVQIIYKILLMMVFVCIIIASAMFVNYYIEIVYYIKNFQIKINTFNESTLNYHNSSSNNTSELQSFETPNIALILMVMVFGYTLILLFNLYIMFQKKITLMLLPNVLFAFIIFGVVLYYIFSLDVTILKIKQIYGSEFELDSNVEKILDILMIALPFSIIFHICLNCGFFIFYMCYIIKI